MPRYTSKANNDQLIKFFLILTLSIIFSWLLIVLKMIFLPIFLAAFTTFLISPIVEFLYKYKIPRIIGIAITLTLAIIATWIFINLVASNAISFSEKIPKYKIQIENMITKAQTFKDNKLNFITADGLKSALSQISISGFVSSTLNSLFSFFSYSLVTLICTIYFLMSFPQLPNKLKKAFPGQRGKRVYYATQKIATQIQKYVWAKFLTSLIAGASVTVPCLFFRVDFAITWGIFAFFFNLIPNIGAILSCMPPVLICALQYEGWTSTLWLLGVLAAAQAVTGNFIEPKILGKSVNLSPTAALFSLFFWGWIWGPIGMIIAVPAMAIVKFTCDNIDSLNPVGVFLGN